MLRAVDDVLEEIGASEQRRLLVLNKADAVGDRDAVRFRHPEGVLVSALTGEGLDELSERIAADFERIAGRRRPAGARSARAGR